MRAVDVVRAGSLPASPVYHVTVLAGVPAVSAVALSNGGPATRCGGLAASILKKSLPAATADAAVSDVRASVPTLPVSAACMLVAVTSGVVPIVNSFGPGVADVVAVSVRSSVEPSGRLSENLIVSPALGLPPTKSIEIAAGDPVGPVT